MLKKIDNTKKVGNNHIAILYPGTALTDSDSGYYSIGRIDHANINAGVTIKMHPHINDDILSYFRSGLVKHTDSEGFEEFIGPKRLMLMKAGKLFYHEESILENNEGLQIFIRPGKKDATPEVIFENLEEIFINNEWRLLASPEKEKTNLQLSSQTWIYDTKLSQGHILELPEDPNPDYAYLLYTYQGTIMVNEDIQLLKGESLFIKDENIKISTKNGAELILFVTNTNAPYYDDGMYSGNKR